MCVCVGCACPTGDWPPCDRPVLTEPARVPLLARCRTGAAAAGHLHSHALLPWDALVLPRRLDMSRGGEQVGARVALQNGLAESLETGAVPSYVPWERVVGIPHAIDVPFLRNGRFALCRPAWCVRVARTCETPELLPRNRPHGSPSYLPCCGGGPASAGSP